MDLRHYLHILKRQRWLIVSTTVVVAFAAGVFASIQTPKYNASSQVLLRPNDPTEELGASSPAQLDLPRYVAAQAAIVKSLPVARAAAQIMDTQQSAEKLAAQISVKTSETSNVLGITATDKDATRAVTLPTRTRVRTSTTGGTSKSTGSRSRSTRSRRKLEILRGRIGALTAAGAGALGADPVQSTQLDLITSQYTSLLVPAAGPPGRDGPEAGRGGDHRPGGQAGHAGDAECAARRGARSRGRLPPRRGARARP